VRSALSWNRRTLGLGLLALALLLGLILVGAPATSRLASGSTWHRGPAGYSAWYESLAQQGISIQRWQRPVEDLLEQLEREPDPMVTLIQNRPTVPDTLLAVLPGFIDQAELPILLPWMPDWLEAGHRLVVLGAKVPATAAPFSQTLPSEVGPVRIDTRRRYGLSAGQNVTLADEYGAVVWRQADGPGEIIWVATPHLAANAYLDQAGNFALLTELVTGEGRRVWVDEYLHGYRDEVAIAAQVGGDSWLNYLARTPLLILAGQGLVVTLLALLAFNHRLGQRLTRPTPPVDNSQAYITALAGVLHKANSHDFVVQTLGQAERLTLQKALGLGSAPLPMEQLQAAWQQQGNRATPDLAALLQPPTPRGDRQLRDWLQRLQSLQSITQETPAGHE
jgi:hypothetical protein